MRLLGIKISDELDALIEEKIASGEFESRHALGLAAIEEFLLKKKKGRPKKEKDSNGKDKATKHYGPDHYRFDSETWEKILGGDFPKNERHDTLIIGAYLLAMEKKGVVKLLRGSEFSGKHGANVKRMLDYFSALHGEDRLAGFREALKYVKWFVNQDDPFIVDSGWALDILFSTSSYRDRYVAKGGSSRKKGALSRNNVEYVLPEERLNDREQGIRM